MIYQKQVAGDLSVNIQAGRDVNFNFDTNDVANIIRDQMSELFVRLSDSDNKLKQEVAALINDNKLEQAKEQLEILVKATTDSISQDFLDFANLYLILEPEKSDVFYKKAIEINPDNNDAKNLYALRLMHVGKLNEAEKILTSNLFETTLTPIQKEAFQGNLGVLYKNSAEWAKSLKYLKSALDLSISNENNIGTVKHLNNIGSCYTNLEDLDASDVYLEKSIKLINELIESCDDKTLKNEYKLIKSNVLTNVSIRLRHLWFKEENYKHLTDAEHTLKVAIEIAEILDEKVEMLRHWGNLSNIYRQMKKPEKAIKYVTKSLGLSVDIGDVRGEVCSLLNLGLVYHDEGSHDTAIDYFKKSLDKENSQYPKLRAHILSNLALANKGNKNKEEGDYYFDKAVALYQELGLKTSINEITQSYGG